MNITIRQAEFPDDTASILDIWREYVASPSVNLDYQGNEAEFANLPGKYAAPRW
jgi:putative acetyltransferase